jgi:hypothetical protein
MATVVVTRIPPGVEVVPEADFPARVDAALARLTTGDFTVEQHGCLVADAGNIGLHTRFGFDGRHRPVGGARRR